MKIVITLHAPPVYAKTTANRPAQQLCSTDGVDGRPLCLPRTMLNALQLLLIAPAAFQHP